MRQITRIALLALALFGTYAGVSLSLSHLNTGETCPVVAHLPACYVVAIGYFLVALSTISLLGRGSKYMFFCGWTPVAVLAGFGVVLP